MDDDDEFYENDETHFGYLKLQCSERLSQMTKTYNDIEAVTKLLEEKEKDLELAAKIGKSLLERNKQLQQTNEFLEEQLNIANEKVTQLKHELQQKIDLLHIFTDSEADSGGSTPSGDRFLNWGTMQRKLRLLEDENLSLKLEAGHLKLLTQGLEEKEQQLVNDCVRQLADANSQLDDLSLELAEKNEEYVTQQREISHLLKELVDRQNSEKKLNYENDEFSAQIQAAQETQLELTQELIDLQERYAEVVALLAETREELKSTKENLHIKRKAESSCLDSMYDSLASELEASDCSFGGQSPFLSSSKQDDYRKNVNRNVSKFIEDGVTSKSTLTTPTLDYGRNNFISSDTDECSAVARDLNPADQSCASTQAALPPDSYHSSEMNVKLNENSLLVPVPKRNPSSESLSGYPAPGIGVPGIPGSKDLEFAIKRLSLRRRVELECLKYRRTKGAKESFSYYNPMFSSSPQHLLSTSVATTAAEIAPVPSKSKTVLVKRVEGSSTMSQWRELATPSLIGALGKRSGIKVKGGSPPNVCVSSSSSSAMVYSTPSPQLLRINDIPAPRPNFVHIDSGVNSDMDGSTIREPADLSWISYSRKTLSTPGTYSFVSSRVMHPGESSPYSLAPTDLHESPRSTKSAEKIPLLGHSVDLLLSPWRIFTGKPNTVTMTSTTNSASVSVSASTAFRSVGDLNRTSVTGGLCDLLFNDDFHSTTSFVSQCPPGVYTRSVVKSRSTKDSESVD